MNASFPLPQFVFTMLFLLMSSGLAPAAGSDDSPVLPYRSMAFTNPEDALPVMIRKGATMGFNDLCVQTEYGDQAGDIRKAREHFKASGILELCEELDISLSLWVHEFMDYDESWGPRELANETLWKALAARYDHYLAELFPEVDYLVLTTTETHHQIDPEDYLLLGKVISVINAACQRHGRQLIYRNFRHGPDWLKDDLYSKFLKEIPRDVIIQSKTVAQDWHMRGLLHPLIGRAVDQGFREIVEFDACGEYFRRNDLCNVWTDELERRLREHLKQGISGISVRVDRRGRNSFGHPNLANAWYLAWATNGQGLDNAQAVEAFCAFYYNEAVAPRLAELLRSTGPVNAEALCIFSDTFGNTREDIVQGKYGSGLDDVTHRPMQPRRWLEVSNPDDPRIAENERVIRGEPEIIEEETRRYAQALSTANHALETLEEMRDALDPEAYALLDWLLEENKFHLIIMQEWQLAWLKAKRAEQVEPNRQAELKQEIRAHLDKVRSMVPLTDQSYRSDWQGIVHHFRERGGYVNIEKVNAMFTKKFLEQ